MSKHGLDRRGVSGSAVPTAYRQMSLRGRSSLRLVGDKAAPPRRGKNAPARTWSSIEAITFPTDSQVSSTGHNTNNTTPPSDLGHIHHIMPVICSFIIFITKLH